MEIKIIVYFLLAALVILALLRCKPKIRLSDIYTGQRYTYRIIIRMKDKSEMVYVMYSDFFYSAIEQIVERKKSIIGDWICLVLKDTEICWNQNEIKEIVMMREEN